MIKIIQEKECKNCHQILSADQFTINKALPDGRGKQCKSCDIIWRTQNAERLKRNRKKYQNKTRDQRKVKAKLYRQKNKAILKEKSKEYAKNHPEKAKARGERYRKRYPERVRKQQYNYVKKRRKIDPLFNLQQKLRSGFYDCLKRSNRRISKTFLRYIGCSPKELKNHLTSQFTNGMTWEKYLSGEIVVDHIIPFPCLDFNYEEDIEAYAGHNNLRPLWKIENTNKSIIDQKLGKLYKNLDRKTRLEINKKILEYVKMYNPDYEKLSLFVSQTLKEILSLDIIFPKPKPSFVYKYLNQYLPAPQILWD